MKKIVKLIAWILATVVLLLVVIAAAVPFFFDPNDHKDQIVALARQHTGRDFKIEGDIALSIFPWLGIHLSKVEVGNPPGFPQVIFAQVDEMQMRVKLLPLIAKRLEMDRLIVRGLVVNLARREDGVSNWDDLVARGATEPSGAGAATALALGGLDIRGATISWRDEQRKERYAIVALDVRTGPLGQGVPMDFTVAFDIEESAAGIRGHVATSGSVWFAPGENKVHADNVTLQATLEGGALPGGRTKLVGRADANFDTASGRLNLSRLAVDGSGFTIAGRPGRISVKGSLAGDLATQTFRLPDLKVAADLGGRGDRGEGRGGARLDASGDVSISMDLGTLTVRSLEFAVPELDLAAVSGALSGSAGLSVDLKSLSYTVDGMAASGTLSVEALQGMQIQFDLKGAINGSIATGVHEAQNLSLATVVRGSDLLGGELAATVVADLDIDANQHAISAQNLRLETTGVTATGSLSARDLAGAPRLQGTLETEPFHPRKVLERLGIRLPATSDPKALHSASIKTDFAATADSAELEHMVVALDDSQISGNVAVRDFETPALDFDVTVDRIDVDRYLPPSAAAGAASRAPAAPGTAAAPGAATASAMATAVETLRGLNATGRIEVGRLQVGGVPLADVRAVIEAKGGLINAAPLSAELYGGSYRGKIRLDARGDVVRLSVDERLAGIRIDKLLHDLSIDPAGMDLSGSSTVALEGSATGDAGRGIFHVEIVSLDARLAGKSFPSGNLTVAAKGRLEVDITKQTLISDGLEVAVGDLVTHSTVQMSNLLTRPSYRGTLKTAAFNPRTVWEQLGQKDIVTADPKALSSARFEARINGTRSSINVEPLALTLDRSKLDGMFGVANFADPAFRFDLTIDDIDADRYLPALGQGKQVPAGTPGAALAVVPTETLRHLNLDGRLRIARMKLGNLRLSNIRVTAKAKNGIVNLHPLRANLYQGRYTGNVRVDARGKRPVLRLDERFERVQLGPLLQDLRGEQPVTGSANLYAKLTATGPDVETIKRTLSGNTRFVLANGEVKGLDLIGHLCALASTVSLTSVHRENIIAGILQLAVRQEAKMTGGTPFTELSGTVNFADGLASNDDLLLTSPVLNFGGRGSVNLTSLWVDYRGVVRLTGSCAARVGRSFRELRGYEIPVHISGPASQPKVEANLASLIPAFAGRGGRQAQPSQSHAVARRQHPPAPPTEEQVIRGLLERLLK